MERRDAENAVDCSVPQESRECAPESYEGVPVEALLAFCREQFRYWTEDAFAAAFRRMLTVEQYRSGDMNAFYHQYLGAGPLQYTADLLGSREAALALYGPMHLLYGVYDGAEEKEEVYALLEAHLAAWRKSWNKTGGEQT